MSQKDKNTDTKQSRSIPEGWVETTLGELGKLARGKSKHRPRWAPHLFGGKYPFIQTGQIKSAEKYITEYEQTYSEEGLAQSKLWKRDTLCITIAANIAEIAILKFPACFPDSVLGFIADKEKSDLNFIYYNFSMVQAELRQLSIGSVQDNINLGTFEKLIFLIPPLPEQKAIANILTAFDDKIENLRAQNDTLEQTAQTIFTEWFGKYQLQDELPEGWRVGKLEEFIKSSIGGDYGKEEITDDFNIKTICLRGTDLPDMKFNIAQKAPIRFLKSSKLDKCRLLNGDIVIEISGGTETQSTGRVMYINEVIIKNSEFPMTCVNFCRIIRPIAPEYSYFIYSTFDYLYNRKVMFNWENGTTGIKNLNLNSMLTGFNLLLPESNIKILEFNELITPIFIKIQTNNQQIHNLTQTRDTLLPKLMSGQLRVKNVETIELVGK